MLGLQIQGFRMECIAKINFSQKSCFMDFRHEFSRFVEVLGAVFLVFCALKASSSSRCQGWHARVPSLREYGQWVVTQLIPGASRTHLIASLQQSRSFNNMVLQAYKAYREFWAANQEVARAIGC